MSAARIRKAWRVWPDWYDGSDGWDCTFAPTAGRARYLTYLRLDGATDLIDIHVRRWKERDMILPAPDEAISQLSRDERKVILHASGASNRLYQTGYRSHYATYSWHPVCNALVEKGLMGCQREDVLHAGMVFFRLTDAGQRAALMIAPVYEGGCVDAD